MDEKKIKMHLPKIDDLFTTQEERDNANNEKVIELDINKIDDFPNHPFKVVNNEVIFSDGHRFTLPAEVVAKYDSIPEDVVLGIRPEDIHQVDAAIGNAQYDIEVKVAELLGHEYYIHTDFGGADMISKFSADVGHEIRLHTTKSVALDLNKIHFFDPKTEYRILTKDEK